MKKGQNSGAINEIGQQQEGIPNDGAEESE